jgi:hypothetical protein
MMVISLPVAAWVNDSYWLYGVTFAVFIVYSVVCLLGIRFSKRFHAKARLKNDVAQ